MIKATRLGSHIFIGDAAEEAKLALLRDKLSGCENTEVEENVPLTIKSESTVSDQRDTSMKETLVERSAPPRTRTRRNTTTRYISN